ncbi:hypothetical protein F9L33_07410 [Amylibacter sp. SFDW26]|uniref:3-deoxy-D-manno-octulosonic acid transferase n=1 Tax=Amylibacter sp. SFDW26 TaxID=2652722 RepID=UPI0012615863|nr:glycosyltransferase N-terminal domain-containing protein [Amylibacter sp. SFDW26]KAB7614461.1 hypothetical protein F9L33_07410 [Amylibacter sp. SFDW26]
MLGTIEFCLYKFATYVAADKFAEKRISVFRKAGLSIERCTGILEDRPEGRLVWFHARDLHSAKPLLELITQLNYQELGLSFLVTTRRAEQTDDFVPLLPENTVHQFLPVDLKVPMTAFLNHWLPDVAVISEGEFWPRMLNKLTVRKVPLIAVNTKMKDKVYRNWLWLPGLAKKVLNTFDLILVQDQFVASRLKRLGAKTTKIRVAGVLAETPKLLNFDESLHSSMSAKIGSRSVWLSAATNRNEEDVIVNAHKIAMRRNRRLLLILHTREKGRGAYIAERHQNKNLTFSFQEKGGVIDDATDVFVSEDVDELATYLQLAPVTFCGGTLSDGQSIDPFHPAAAGSAIIHGPSYGDHRETYTRYNEAEATRQVSNGGELANTLTETIGPDVAAMLAHKAWEISSEGGEVSGTVISEILEKLADGAQTDAAT